MEIIKSWIVERYKHLVLLSNGSYMLGYTSNVYGYEVIPELEALELISISGNPPERKEKAK